MQARKRVAVCLPGYNFSWDWLRNWCQTQSHLDRNYDLFLSFGAGNNIYQVRNQCVKNLRGISADLSAFDYIFWIDSDNPPTPQAFEILRETLDQDPDISAIGGWYLMDPGVTDGKQTVAAGYLGEDEHLGIHMPIDRKNLLGLNEPIMVHYIGFGCLVMRPKMLVDLGPAPFRPVLAPAAEEGFLTDDVGFCYLAIHKGHVIALHTGVHVRHLKSGAVPDQEQLRQEIISAFTGTADLAAA